MDANDFVKDLNDAQELMRNEKYKEALILLGRLKEIDKAGDFDYNLSLSRKRAEAVVDFLISHGINSSRTLYRGFGSTKPISSNDSEDGRQLNRRVEFLIVHK